MLVGMEMTERRWTEADLSQLVSRARFTLVVAGREYAWVRSLAGDDPEHAEVEISLDQLTIQGLLAAVRERVGALVELLDEVAAHPERWGDLRLTKVGERHWHRDVPHPFSRPAPGTQLVIIEPAD
jgi:hypothetical protein